MNLLGAIGRSTLERVRYLRTMGGMIWALLRVSFSPLVRHRTIRDVLARQILFTGVEASRFIILVSLLIGVSVVVQAHLWLERVGQSALLGPLLVTVIVRELGPLLVNFIVIGRSGTAIATELGTMRVAGEIKLLDSQGLDPLIYLVWPRVMGLTISVFCLSIIFVVFSLFSGYLSGALFGGGIESPTIFINSILGAVTPLDVINLISKSLIPGLLTGTICCFSGMSATARHEIPQVTTGAVVKSVTALFVTLAIISVLSYV